MSPPVHHDEADKTLLGFWVYLMTDCILFASLFAAFVVLRGGPHGGPESSELFSLPFVLVETLILLTSSFTAGLALLAARRAQKTAVLQFLAVTFLLGVAFLSLEMAEFNKLVQEGHAWHSNAFMSAFFTLVGTHGLHILSGLIWLLVLVSQLLRGGLTNLLLKRMMLFGMFWHFLDIVWIFIFSVVYLMGAIT